MASLTLDLQTNSCPSETPRLPLSPQGGPLYPQSAALLPSHTLFQVCVNTVSLSILTGSSAPTSSRSQH